MKQTSALISQQFCQNPFLYSGIKVIVHVKEAKRPGKEAM